MIVAAIYCFQVWGDDSTHVNIQKELQKAEQEAHQEHKRLEVLSITPVKDRAWCRVLVTYQIKE